MRTQSRERDYETVGQSLPLVKILGDKDDTEEGAERSCDSCGQPGDVTDSKGKKI